LLSKETLFLVSDSVSLFCMSLRDYAASILLKDHIEPAALAADLFVSTRTLDRWHTLRKGPPRVIVGGRVWYRRDAVEQWLQSRTDRHARSPKASRARTRRQMVAQS
jgi:hypothetical protein